MKSSILPYLAQPDAVSCQAAAIGQVTGNRDIAAIRAALLRTGVAGCPWNMGGYLQGRVKSYEFISNASLFEAREALDDGYTCITHGWFTRSGHIVVLKGWEPAPETLGYRFLVDDPWWEFDFPGWRYLHGRSGDNVRYSAWGMYAACVAGSSAAHARSIYRRGELNSSMKNMWLHLVKN